MTKTKVNIADRENCCMVKTVRRISSFLNVGMRTEAFFLYVGLLSSIKIKITDYAFVASIRLAFAAYSFKCLYKEVFKGSYNVDLGSILVQHVQSDVISVFPNIHTCKCAGNGFVHCGIFHISAVHSICLTAHHPYTK